MKKAKLEQARAIANKLGDEGLFLGELTLALVMSPPFAIPIIATKIARSKMNKQKQQELQDELEKLRGGAVTDELTENDSFDVSDFTPTMERYRAKKFAIQCDDTIYHPDERWTSNEEVYAKIQKHFDNLRVELTIIDDLLVFEFENYFNVATFKEHYMSYIEARLEEVDMEVSHLMYI